MGWVVSVTTQPRFTPGERTPGTHWLGRPQSRFGHKYIDKCQYEIQEQKDVPEWYASVYQPITSTAFYVINLC
jgi:hypothetical protein